MINLIILFGLPGTNIDGYVKYIEKNGVSVKFNTIKPENITHGWNLKSNDHSIGLDKLMYFSKGEDDVCDNTYIIGVDTVKDALSIYTFLNSYPDQDRRVRWLFVYIDKKGKYNRLFNACKFVKNNCTSEVSTAFEFDTMLNKFMDESNTAKNARFVLGLFDALIYNDNIESMCAYVPEKTDHINTKTVCGAIIDFLSD